MTLLPGLSELPTADPSLDPGTAMATLERTAPLWNVILLDDDHHTMQFVVVLLVRIFRKTPEDAFALMMEVHTQGRAIAATVSKERAELYLEQVAAMPEPPYGPLGCVMEPAE